MLYETTQVKSSVLVLKLFPLTDSVLVVKTLPAKARDVRDTGCIPGSGGSPGGGNGSPLQYSCLENPKDTGGSKATVHRVAQSRTRLQSLGTL